MHTNKRTDAFTVDANGMLDVIYSVVSRHLRRAHEHVRSDVLR